MTDHAPAATTRKMWRPRFRFSLRALFLLVTVIALWLGYAMNAARQQREAVRALDEAGFWVRYDYHVDGAGRWIALDTSFPGESWLVDLLGVDFFYDVVYVYMRTGVGSDPDPVGSPRVMDAVRLFRKLRRATLGECQLKDTDLQ